VGWLGQQATGSALPPLSAQNAPAPAPAPAPSPAPSPRTRTRTRTPTRTLTPTHPPPSPPPPAPRPQARTRAMYLELAVHAAGRHFPHIVLCVGNRRDYLEARRLQEEEGLGLWDVLQVRAVGESRWRAVGEPLESRWRAVGEPRAVGRAPVGQARLKLKLEGAGGGGVCVITVTVVWSACVRGC
jgi:hypothetical protein